MSQHSDPLHLVGALVERKYLLQRVVAEGGFGVVYAARHIALDQPIAVKVLKPRDVGSDDWHELFSHFASEAQTIARLRHPNIVSVLDWGSTETHVGALPWMALEWLDGPTLRDDLLARRGSGGRSREACLALIGPIIDAIAHAHAAGIAHRDIKPSNVLLVPSERGVVPRIVDFGIAKAMRRDARTSSDATTTQGPRAYSLPYAAPEQLAGTRTGPWTDVHALGLVLTEMLTDQPAYVGDDRDALHAAIFDARRPSTAAHGVDVGAWEPVIARALALRSADRYQTAGELAAALAAATADEASAPPVAAPAEARRGADPSPSDRPRGARRRGVAIGLAGAVAVAAGAAGVSVIVGRSGAAEPTQVSAKVDPLEPSRSYVARRIPLESERTVYGAALLRGGNDIAWIDDTALWVQPLDGGERRRVPFPPELAPPPSAVHALPDAESFLVSLGETKNAAVLHADGRASAPIAVGGPVVAVSPDGKRVLVRSSEGLFETGLDDTAAARPLVAGASYFAASWERTTGAIAWISHTLERSELGLTSPNGSTRKLLTSDDLMSLDGALDVAWLGPHELAFARQPNSWTDPHGIVALDPEHPGHTRPIFTWTDRSSIDALGAMGGRISFLKSTARESVHRALVGPDGRLVDGGPRLKEGVGLGGIVTRGAGVLADGRAFLTTFEENERRLFVVEPSGATTLVDASALPLSARQAPPAVLASGELMFWRQRPGVACELVRARPGGPATVVSREDAALPCDTAIRCASDGSRCVAKILQMGAMSLAWLDPKTLALEVVYRRGSTDNFGFDVSPAGDLIAFVQGDGRIDMLDAKHALREYLVVENEGANIQTVRFTADGRGLLLAGTYLDGAKNAILRADLAGHARVLFSSPTRWMMLPTESPDGKSLVYFEREYESSLWLLEPGLADDDAALGPLDPRARAGHHRAP